MDEGGWASALDELEREVERAEHLAAASAIEHLTEWAPPTGLGPLPRHLLTRAQGLSDRQQAVIARLSPLLVATRQQLQVGHRIGQATVNPTAPVYVNITA